MPWATPLIARSVDLAALERDRRLAAGGEFRCTLLVAEAGIGKTRLAQEFLQRVRGKTTGLAARAYRLGETTPFGLWSEALESHLRRLGAAEIRELCGGFLDDLAALIRSVAAARGSAPEREPPRIRILEGLAFLLGNLAARRQVVIFLDDAHAADSSSWEALHYLARNLGDRPVLVIAAARPDELAENATGSEVLLSLEQEGLLERHDLEPLDGVAIGELAGAVVDGPPPPALVAWLVHRSGGYPLFALGLIQALVEEGADLSAPQLRAIPEQLAGRVARRMEVLDGPTLGTLEALAIAEGPLELPDLVALSALPIERLGGVVEQLVRSRLVAEVERGRQLSYEIAHPLIGQSVYERIGGARRRDLHRRLARVLLESGRLAEAAPHFARSAAVGDDEAIAALRDAVRQAESREAYREALTMLDALAQLIPANDRRWLDVLSALEWRAEWVIDHRADMHAVLGIRALRAIDRLLDKSPQAGPRAAVKFRLAHLLAWGPGELAEAEEACREARGLFEEVGDRGSTLLAENELAWIRGLRGDHAGMEAAAELVASAAEEIGDGFAAIQALFAIGQAAWLQGRFRRGEDALQRCIQIARNEGKVYRLTVGLGMLATCVAVGGRPAEAVPLLEEAKASDPVWRESALPEWESIVHWYAGDFPKAAACVREAMARTVGDLSKRRAIGVIFGVLAAAEAGFFVQAGEDLARVRRALGDREWQFLPQACKHAEAMITWQQDGPAAALAALREVPDQILGTGARPFAALAFLDLAELAAEGDDEETAGQAARDLTRIGEGIDASLYIGLAAMGSAWAKLAAGDARGAVEAAQRAVDGLSDSTCRGFRARGQYVLGRSLLKTDPPAAIGVLKEAAAAYGACGAVWRRERTRECLRGIGSLGRRAASVALGPDALSRRERQVARLAVEGKTAAEIGERLFIGERTVETHLANIYAKLGVRSKLDLVRRASDLKLGR
jgi:DNA-binding CsgD family transcriptional regulator